MIVGIIAYTLLYLGKVIQKYAIENIKEKKSIKNIHSGTWIFGTFLTALFLVIHWIALLIAPINIIAPLEGIGLIFFLIFSHILLKEKLIKIEFFGIILVIIGTFCVTFFNPNLSTIQKADYNFNSFIILTIFILAIEFVLIFILTLKKPKFVGLLLSITAGTFMALETVTKRITVIPDITITIIFSILTIVFGILSLFFTQLAFAKTKANIVIPSFTSTSISLAIIIGIIVLNESIILIQIIGIFLIITGVIFLTAFRKEN
ncbi:MAG: DMT family transporter [Candidatus Hermodarchaeota archaeon]